MKDVLLRGLLALLVLSSFLHSADSILHLASMKDTRRLSDNEGHWANVSAPDRSSTLYNVYFDARGFTFGGDVKVYLFGQVKKM